PVPDQTSVAAGERVLEAVDALAADDLVLALISGGGSALVEAPASPVTLEDIARTTDLLLRAGADIQALNAVRRRLSRIKGGGLAAAIAPARVVNLIVSDVLGNPLPVIASGPTVPADLDLDPTALVRGLGVWYRLPDRAQQALAGAAKARGGEGADVLASVILAGAASAAEAAAEGARRCGYHPVVLGTEFAGEAREFARFWSVLARHARGGQGPLGPP